jgi:hypothetical protein
MTDSAFLGYLIGVCLSIATLGLAQGRVLGHLTVVAWFAVTLIGIVSGAGVGFLASIPAEMVISQQVGEGWEKLGTIVIGMALAGSTVGASIFGAITGRALIVLLKWGDPFG